MSLVLPLALGLLLGLPQEPAGPPDDAPRPAIGSMERLLAQAYPPGEPGAVALVVRGDATLLRQACGLADLENAVPMAPEGVFHVASITKVFTAVLVLRLVERGELALDDEVTARLPAAPAAWAGMTVEHLLGHTAGLPELLERDDLGAWIRQARTTAELLAEIAARPLAFAPGSAEAYGNSASVVLGALVEELSGRSFGDVLHEELVVPLGLGATRHGALREIVPRRVRGYAPAPQGGWRNEVFYDPSVLGAAGGLLSCADDLGTFGLAFCEGRVLAPELVTASLEPRRLGWAGRTRHGLGWELAEVGGQRAGLKGGDISGFRHYLLVVPAERLVVVLLTNRTDEANRPGPLVLRLAELALQAGG